jgi:hypothetical protein
VFWLFAPFGSALLIGVTPALRWLVARFWLPCVILGWAGLLLLAASLLALDGTLESAGPPLGGLLGGLSMWKRAGGGDDGGGDPPDDDPGPPPPGGEWERFEDDFWRYLDDKPRAPALV